MPQPTMTFTTATTKKTKPTKNDAVRFRQSVARSIWRCVSIAICGFWFCASVASAQNQESKLVVRKIYINSLSLSGNKALLEEDLRAQIETKENTTYFGFFKPWVGIYWLVNNDSSFIQTFVRRLFGESPAYYSPRTFADDVQRLKTYYGFFGYFQARIDTTIRLSADTSSVKLDMAITEGKPTLVDSIHYNFSGLDGTTMYESVSKSLLKKNDIYSVKLLVQERDRLYQLMQESGYALTTPDSIKAVADTLNNLAGITFFVNASHRYRFGKITAIVHNDIGIDADSLRLEQSNDSLDVRVYSYHFLRPQAIARMIAYKAGDYYSNKQPLVTQRRLGSMDLFESINVIVRRDSVLSGDSLSTLVDLKLLPRFQIKPELIINNLNNAPNISLDAVYLNRNLFGSAENFRLKGTFGVQLGSNRFQNDTTRTNPSFLEKLILNFNVEADLIFPYFYTPENRLTLTSSFGIYQQQTYTQQIALFRSRINLTQGEFQKGVLDLQAEFVKLVPGNGFDSLLIAKSNQTELSVLKTHLNSAIRYEFTFSNLTQLSRKLDFQWVLSAEEAGLLPLLVDKFIDHGRQTGSPDNDPNVFGLKYFQYFRFESNITGQRPFSPIASLGFKILLGAVIPYGQNITTPLEKHFYSGGPNSLRAWAYNGFGPGLNNNASIATLGGDVKIELGLENRFVIQRFQSFSFGAAVFTDAGNVWSRNGEDAFGIKSFYKQMGWDVGYGIRFLTLIGTVRFDLAYRVYDPTDPTQPWQYKTWRPFSSSHFNFGIGEAF
jgi:outer membrane protein insertion porin family